MSQSVFQPVGQKRLTNIAVVRYKKHGHRFEIACYKNKIVNWRNGVEKDLDEVLQTTAVFANVSKGILAKREDLIQTFGTDDENIICMKILAEGEMQVSDKERKVELETLFRDVASVLSEKCINPESNRPYTISMLERALHDVHFSVDPKRPAKTQALEALPVLKARFPIERARMRLRLTVPISAKDELNDLLASKGAVIEEQELVGTMISTLCLIEPGAFRPVHVLVQAAKGGGRVEVVALAATAGEAEATGDFESLSVSTKSSTAPTIIIADDIPGPGNTPKPSSSTNTNTTNTSTTTTGSRSGYMAAPVATMPVPRRVATMTNGGVGSITDTIVYPRGPLAGLPEEHASRKERFAELDVLQQGWTVELRSKAEGGTVDAVFYSPTGQRVGAYAMARRMALQASKETPAPAAV